MHHAQITAQAPALPLTDKLAQAMLDQLADGECTESTLRAAGFSDDDLSPDNLTAARAIANGRFVRVVETISRPDRIRKAADAIEGIMPNRKVILATMEAAGIKDGDDLFAEACALAGDNFARPGRVRHPFVLTFVLDGELREVTVRAADRAEADRVLLAINETGRVRPVPSHPAEAH